ncbi:MAG: hypothetical protein JWO88_3258 [Frankiales bacterium]|nr:hypothetical protein [Frankiales bacterium]
MQAVRRVRSRGYRVFLVVTGALGVAVLLSDPSAYAWAWLPLLLMVCFLAPALASGVDAPCESPVLIIRNLLRTSTVAVARIAAVESIPYDGFWVRGQG